MMDNTMFKMMGFGAPSVAADAGLKTPVAAGQEKGKAGEFVNLLDVAANMETGDFQNQAGEEWMAQLLGQIQGNDAKGVELLKQNLIAGLGQGKDGEVKLSKDLLADGKDGLIKGLVQVSALAGTNLSAAQIQEALKSQVKGNPEQLKVGQKNPVDGASETQLLNEWAINSLGADQALAQQQQSAATAQNLPSAFAVGQWAQAISEGDLKNVEVTHDDDQQPAGAKTATTAADLLMVKDGQSDTKVSALEFLNKRMAAPVDGQAQAVSVDGKVAVKNTAATNQPSANQANAASQGQVGAKSAPKATEGFVAMGAKDLPKVGANERVIEEKKPVQAKAADAVSGKPVSAREFLLNKETALSENSAKLAPKTAPALVQADKLGASDDRRVSHQAVDFVADKIDTLKAAGGGTLRVHLDPKDLGSVMLKVSSRGGLTKVEIVADKSETAALLTQNKGDLRSRLESAGYQTSLTIDQGSLGGASASRLNRNAGVSSLDFVNMDPEVSGSSEPLTNNAVRSANGSASSQSASQEGSGDSWSRDERREFAREQWNSSREDKKSA